MKWVMDFAGSSYFPVETITELRVDARVVKTSGTVVGANVQALFASGEIATLATFDKQANDVGREVLRRCNEAILDLQAIIGTEDARTYCIRSSTAPRAIAGYAVGSWLLSDLTIVDLQADVQSAPERSE